MKRSDKTTMERLLVVSHVVHYEWEGRLFAYGPYAREIDMMAELFPEIVIAAPRGEGKPPGDATAFVQSNVVLAPLPQTGGDTLWAKLSQIGRLPELVCRLALEMRRADALHVRCPGNLGLLGAAIGPIFSRRRMAKYAGQWNGYEGEGFSVRLQRALLRSRWWGAPVTVYGEWAGQPDHVHPFFTSMMTSAQVERASEVSATKTLGVPLRVMFSGRLSFEKRVEALISGFSIALGRGIEAHLRIVGDGPERPKLEASVHALRLVSKVEFKGALSIDESIAQNEWAHCLVLPSQHSEGWPKVVAEAMCYGVLCIAVAHGTVPTMLAGRGILLRTGSAEEIADVLARIAQNHAAFEPLMKEASRWARNYSLEGLKGALKELLAREWKIVFPEIARTPVGRRGADPAGS